MPDLPAAAVKSALRLASSATFAASAEASASDVLGEARRTIQETALPTVVPAGDRLEANLRVPVRVLAFLAVGDEVSLREAARPLPYGGNFKGHVTEISRDGMAADRSLAGEPMAIVRVALDERPACTGDTGLRLHHGTTLEADLPLGRRRLASLFLESLRGTAPGI